MFVNHELGENIRYDAVLVGAGVMSSTLAVLLKELDPQLKVLIVEKLSQPGLESSYALNNAGTGHAGNCELNYTPLKPDGRIELEKALRINSSFEQSLEFWASLTQMGKLDPERFLHFLPHISLVFEKGDVAFLKKRYELLRQYPAFSDMEWTEDINELKDWMPLLFNGRRQTKNTAATRIKRGTDIDFGSLSISYLETLSKKGLIDIEFSTEVVNLRKNERSWDVEMQNDIQNKYVTAPFVFIGAGGGSLPLLQKSKITEGSSYGGFPVSGQWLICNKPSLAKQHSAKVYGKAKLGAPPMSVPHLDTRWIDGERSLLFGPFAGFSTKFLKKGSYLDLFKAINTSNFASLLQAGIKNLDLVNYLFSQLRLDHKDRVDVLRNFLPTAKDLEWKLFEAGQRVQIIKSSTSGGILKMGTEVVCSSDGSLSALLGASPGASTAVTTMLEVLQRCWGEKMETDEWKERLKNLFPGFGETIHDDPDSLKNLRDRNDAILGFSKNF